MFRTQQYQHLPDRRRLSRVTADARQAVRPGHVFAWEFGELLEHHDGQTTDAVDATPHAMFASLDKALALAG